MTNERATIREVASAAGVSIATVSRVLNGRPGVNAEMSARVRAAAEACHYVPNGAGRALRLDRSNLWAALVPDANNSFFTRVVSAFGNYAADEGHVAVLCNTMEDVQRERAHIDALIAQRVAGVLIAATSATKSSLVRLTEAGIPIVAIDRRVSGFGGDSVGVDNVMMGRMAAKHLLSRNVERPLLVTGPRTRVSSTADRDAGFLEAMATEGISLADEDIVRIDLRAQSTKRLLHGLEDALGGRDAVFATNGPISAASFGALQQLGREVPRDLLFMGVDDEVWTTIVTPRVTVLSQPAEEIGEWAGRLLSRRQSNGDVEPCSILLQGRLLVRESTMLHRTDA